MALVGAVVKSEELTQIPLDIRLDTSLVFDNFHTNPQNQQVVDEVRASINKPEIVILKGASTSGKTHLLQAVCNSLDDGDFMYVPARNKSLLPEILKTEANLKCVCIDDVDLLLGDVVWEKSIFDLYNLAFDKNFGLLFSLSKNDLHFKLADLKSRFSKTKMINLPTLDDAGKREVFLLQAKSRGVKIDAQVSSYIHNHFSRNLHDMLVLLDKLDQTSMCHKHRITIPMVKQVIQDS